jgi:hypothetical protein
MGVFFFSQYMMLSFFLTNAFEQMALGVQEKRLKEVLQYQALFTDLEKWLSTVNATLRAETRPTSPKAIRDQLLAHEVSILYYYIHSLQLPTSET